MERRIPTAKERLTYAYDISNLMQYELLLEDFIDTNPLGDEMFFIDLLTHNQTKRLLELRDIVDFFSVNEETFKHWYDNKEQFEKELDEWLESKVLRDEYWKLYRYRQLLQERQHFLRGCKNIEAETEKMLKGEVLDKIRSKYESVYINTNDTNSEENIEEKAIKFLRTRRPSTEARYKEYRDYVNNLMTYDALKTNEATRMAAKKFNVSIDTIDRAMEFKE